MIFNRCCRSSCEFSSDFLSLLCPGGSSKTVGGKSTPSRRRVIDDDDFINDDDLDDDDLLPPPPPVKKTFTSPGASTAPPPVASPVKKSFVNLVSPAPGPSDASKSSAKTSSHDADKEKDNSFREFRKLCADIANENSHTGKTALVAKYIEKGSTGSQSPFSLILCFCGFQSKFFIVFCFQCLADCTNGCAFVTQFCLSVCLSVMYVLWLNGTSYQKTVNKQIGLSNHYPLVLIRISIAVSNPIFP